MKIVTIEYIDWVGEVNEDLANQMRWRLTASHGPEDYEEFYDSIEIALQEAYKIGWDEIIIVNKKESNE